jgi:hypothetical protein
MSKAAAAWFHGRCGVSLFGSDALYSQWTLRRYSHHVHRIGTHLELDVGAKRADSSVVCND